MSKLRIESKAQIMRDKSIQRDKGAYKKQRMSLLFVHLGWFCKDVYIAKIQKVRL